MPETLSPIEKIRLAKEVRAEQARQDAAKLEAEKVANEAKEARRGELPFEREQVVASKEAAEQAAGKAKKEADEARILQAKMGADIDDDTAAAFKDVFAAESKADAELKALEAKLAQVDSEIKALESEEGIVIDESSEGAVFAENGQTETKVQTPIETKDDREELRSEISVLLNDIKSRESAMFIPATKYAERLITEPEKIPGVLEAIKEKAETPFLDTDEIANLRTLASHETGNERGNRLERLYEEQEKQGKKLEEKRIEIESFLSILDKLVQSGGDKVKVAELQQVGKKMIEDHAKLAEAFDKASPELGGLASREAVDLFLDHPDLYQQTEPAKGLLAQSENYLKSNELEEKSKRRGEDVSKIRRDWAPRVARIKTRIAHIDGGNRNALF